MRFLLNLLWLFSLKNCRDLHFHEHLLSRNFKGLSSKCSVEAIKNTTLCKVQIVSNGLSTDVIECLVSSQRNLWWRREMSAVFLGQYFFHRLRLLSHVPLNTFAIANFVVERYEGCLNCLFWFRSFGILFVFSAFLKIFLGVQTWASAIPNWCHQRNATLSYRTGTTNLSLMKKNLYFT